MQMYVNKVMLNRDRSVISLVHVFLFVSDTYASDL